jgi:hypothetical protein
MTHDQTTSTSEQTAAPAGPIVARAGRYYRNTRYLLSALVIGMGLWFAYDGYIGWPEQNRHRAQLVQEREAADRAGDQARHQELTRQIMEMKERTEFDIGLQRVLGWTLPPLGLLLLAWALFNSRGEYRLEHDVLHAPGHPPVALGDVKDVDRKLWDRKGIAYIHYEQGGKSGKIKLDDFVYERQPIDAIYERVSGLARGA